ncbi:MAG: AsmA family protein [Hydrogenophaga sp.]|nr:AsmA family protein [Hydrogenophaga sp.]
MLVLVLLLCELAGWPFLRGPLQNAVARGSGLSTTLEGDFRLRLLRPPVLRVGHLRMAAAEGFDVPHLLDARDIELKWRWGDLRRWRQGGQLRVRSLEAAELDAHLVRTEDGRATWLGEREQPEEERTGARELPRIGRLVVGQGTIGWVDQPLDVALGVRLEGREGASLEAGEAGYVALIEGRYRALPMKLEARAGSTLPLLNEDDASAGRAPWVPLRVEGTVASSRILFDGRAAALLGAPRWEGGLHFRGPSLAQVGQPLGVTLPQTPPFDLRGRIAQEGGEWRLQVERATIGSSELAGDLRYFQRENPPRLVGQLSGPRLALADLGPAVGGANPGVSDRQASGRVLPQRRFDLPSLKAMNAEVQMELRVLDFGTEAVAPMQGLKTLVRLDGGVLRLEDLQATVAGGRVSGLTQLDANASPARWEARLQFAGIDIAGWLRTLRPDNATAPPPRNATAMRREREQARQGGQQPQAYITGELAGDLDVNGAGRSTAEILGSLNGRAQLNVRDGTLSHLATEVMGLDVAQALGLILTGDRSLPLNCARLSLVARDGVVQPRPAVLDNADSTIWITGQVNLRNEQLDLRAITRPKDWSPLSLRTPITVTGTLGDPDMGIETAGLVGRVLGALALGALAGPAAALIPLIEQGGGNVENPCAPGQTAPPPQAAPPAAQPPAQAPNQR